MKTFRGLGGSVDIIPKYSERFEQYCDNASDWVSCLSQVKGLLHQRSVFLIFICELPTLCLSRRGTTIPTFLHDVCASSFSCFGVEERSSVALVHCGNDEMVWKVFLKKLCY